MNWYLLILACISLITNRDKQHLIDALDTEGSPSVNFPFVSFGIFLLGCLLFLCLFTRMWGFLKTHFEYDSSLIICIIYIYSSFYLFSNIVYDGFSWRESDVKFIRLFL